jgi:hypothetical protein
MKYLITENQIKRIIKKNFGLDLTDNISMVTNQLELPFEFTQYIPRKILNQYLNVYGPMYVITTPKNMYLGQERANGWIFSDSKDRLVSEREIMKELGIHPLGLTMNDVIDTYIND